MLTGGFKRVSLFCLADIKKKNHQLLGFKSHTRDFNATQIMKFNHLTLLVASLHRVTRGHMTDFSSFSKVVSRWKVKAMRSFCMSKMSGSGLGAGMEMQRCWTGVHSHLLCPGTPFAHCWSLWPGSSLLPLCRTAHGSCPKAGSGPLQLLVGFPFCQPLSSSAGGWPEWGNPYFKVTVFQMLAGLLPFLPAVAPTLLLPPETRPSEGTDAKQRRWSACFPLAAAGDLGGTAYRDALAEGAAHRLPSAPSSSVYHGCQGPAWGDGLVLCLIPAAHAQKDITRRNG